MNADKPKLVQLLYCSFCGKSQSEILRLIAGPTVFICDECVDVCAEIVADARADQRLHDLLRKYGEVVVSKADAALIAWMKTGETVPPARQEAPHGEG